MVTLTHVQRTRPQWEAPAEVWALAALILLPPEAWKTQLNQSPSQFSCKTLASTQEPSNTFPFANDSLSHVSEATRRPGRKDLDESASKQGSRLQGRKGDKPVGIWIINVTAALDTQSDNAQKVSNMNGDPVEPIPAINHRLSISLSYNYQGISIRHTFNSFIILITIFLMYSEFSSFTCDHSVLTEAEGCVHWHVCACMDIHVPYPHSDKDNISTSVFKTLYGYLILSF